MPKMKCQKDGKEGLKYSHGGTCYTGKDKEKKVNKQIAAMYASGYKGDKKK